MLAENFGAGRGSTVRIEGGTVGLNLEAVDADVVVNGGSIARQMAMFGNSSLTVNAGEVSRVAAHAGATVTVNGGQVTATSIGPTNWTLNDGEVFIDDAIELDFTMQGGRVGRLTAHNGSSVVINGGESLVVSVRNGSTLDVVAGNHESVGVRSGSSGKIHGGRFHGAGASDGGVLELYGGNFTTFTDRVDGKNLANTGGVGARDSTLRMYGGAYGDEVDWIESVIEIYGVDFKIDGNVVAGLEHPGDSVEVDLSTGNHFTSHLTGILSDGTPLAFFDEQPGLSQLVDSTVRLFYRAPPAIEHALVTVSSGQGPLGARPGQTVILEDGGFFDDNFTAAEGSVVLIRGGEVYQNFDVAGGEVSIEGGQVGERMGVLPGGTVNITGGTVGGDPAVYAGGVLSLDGGTFLFGGTAKGGTFNLMSGTAESGFGVTEGGEANISGGLMRGRLNVMENSFANVTGGHINNGIRAQSGSQVSMSGGRAAFDALADSTVIITGGIIDTGSNAQAGANVDISGGGLGDSLVNGAEGGFVLHGQHFEIDGTPIAGLTHPGDEQVVTVGDDQLFTGTLADGSPFVITRDEGDRINTVRLVRSADLPTGPTRVEVSSGMGPGGAYAGQHLTLVEGGALPTNFNAGRDSVVTILGGSTGNNFEAYASIVNIEGGAVGDTFGAFAESEVNIAGGSVGSFHAFDGAVVNVQNGVLSSTEARSGAAINLSGGQIESLSGRNGSQIVWTGGTVASLEISGVDASLDVYGVDFHVDGSPLTTLVDEGSSLQLDLDNAEILTGTLADGTPLVLGSFDPRLPSGIQAGTMTLFRSARPAPLEPAVIQVDSHEAPFAVGLDQTLQLESGGQLPRNFIAGAGSRVDVVDGVILPGFRTFDSEISIDGGEIGANFLALRGTDLLISGGQIDSGLHLFAGSNTKIRGGSITDRIRIDDGAIVDLFGSSFLLSDQPISGLDKLGDVITLHEREFQRLTAVLGDGSQLEWILAPHASRRNSFYVEVGATLRLHLIPEPATSLIALTTLLAYSSIPRRTRQ